ncbi:MAG: hypothetical protein RJB66_1401 [Pseudomonadota bacterium]
MSSEIFSSQWGKFSVAERKAALNSYAGELELKVVYLDDEPLILELISEKIEQFGFTPFCTQDSQAALEYIRRHRSAIAMIISDFKMPKTDGFIFRQQVLALAPEIPFTIHSGFVDREMALRGMELKIASFIEKPVKDEDFFKNFFNECQGRLEAIREERELLKGFTDDASNLVEQAEELILLLEENPQDQDTVSKIFGIIHTIKGSSGFFEPRTLHSFAHRFEDTLKEIQSGKRTLTPGLVSIWLKSCDTLKTLITEFRNADHNLYNIEELTKIFSDQRSTADTPISLQASHESGDHPPADTQKLNHKTKGPQEIKVSVTLLDEFMQISGEMTVIRNMINKIVRTIEKQYPADKDVNLLSELLGELHKVNSLVQAKITEIRKVPVRSVVKPLSRIIRDTAQTLAKEVELKVNGDEILIDTSVAEALSNSLIHLVRNSLDHGIEMPTEREQKGKNKRGEVKISARLNNETIFIDIQDDGKGINPDAIRNKLISNGTHTRDQVMKMSLPDLYQMIFSAGFSTAQKITDLSGRGVGMSMVKDVVEAIGGKIVIESQINKGTQFTLNIPVPKSVLITNCLFVSAQNMQFGVPQDQIRRILNVDEAKNRGFIESLDGTEILRIEEELIPIISLKAVLNGKFQSESNKIDEGYLIILNAKTRNFCLWVDSVQDVEDTVVKTITTGQIKNIGLYLGATFLGDGGVGLILNVEGLAQKAGISLEKLQSKKLEEHADSDAQEKTLCPTINVILCKLQSKTLYAIPQESIFRLEEFKTDQLQQNGSLIVAPYRDRMITFVDMERFITTPHNFNPVLSPQSSYPTLVIAHKTGYIGLIVQSVLDLVTTYSQPQEGLINQPGCQGWLLIGEKSVVLVDVKKVIEQLSQPSESQSLEASGSLSA